ncbi:MAG: serine hydrolase [Pseudonocardiales bacterium]|nr:MAG: serine hydrolase [Pseudonocardiales bacterium]
MVEDPHAVRTLRVGSAAEAGLSGVEAIASAAAAGLRPAVDSARPHYPGYVVLAARNGIVALRAAGGHVLRYADAGGADLPGREWIAARPDTIFDVASLTKLFTSIAVMQQVESSGLELDRPVSSYLPDAATRGPITPRHLLTHTSGLPAEPDPSLYAYDSMADRVAAIHASVPFAPPGTSYCYSDINLITLGFLVEAVSGSPLDDVVRAGITEPLGMPDTGFRRTASHERTAPTEYEADPPRGLVWGEVHDENAWSLGGVAGHAGVFSTADDLAILCQAILDGGVYDGVRILRAETVAAMLREENAGFPGHAHGLGFELDQDWYMGELSSPWTAGHTGFTGTSMVLDRRHQAFVLLLSNRVHPSRDWGKINSVRANVATAFARALR